MIDQDSKHILICISGMISEEENDKREWRYFSQMAEQIYYLKTKKVAKIQGRLLAYTLALRYPFKLNTISIVCFSLGSQLTKQCIKTLHRLNLHDIIHNVTFIAGATNISHVRKTDQSESMDMIIAKTVSGTVKNIHNSKDLVLLWATYIFTPKSLIGTVNTLVQHNRNLWSHEIRNMLQGNEERVSLKAIEDEHLYRFENYDLTDYVIDLTYWDKENNEMHLGHFFYRKKFDRLIERVNFRL
ncbi:UNKNOWN [Stylonychia lemnae]|uniref:DUF726 domain-containing protein n=1 Tax=Stylonychia lemnae TaxID=5949 RepID=A0A078B8B3_STYLE|nr:UNKNOWN [Stylonychia lemnae]|eukprot:CDW90431.1 UNKNOWN [Stylonychia lemnae]